MEPLFRLLNYSKLQIYFFDLLKMILSNVISINTNACCHIQISSIMTVRKQTLEICRFISNRQQLINNPYGMNTGTPSKYSLLIAWILNRHECIGKAYRIDLCYLEHEDKACDKSLPVNTLKFQDKLS